MVISTKLITCRRGPLVRPARSSAATSGRGGVRETGHGGGVGEHRGVARALAHLVGRVEGAGEAGARRSKARGGSRSSASSGNELRGTGRPPEGLGGTLVALGARRDARFGRRRAEMATATWTAARASAVVGNGATARKRGGEERGTAAELTADLQGCSLWPGTRWRRRIGVGGRRRLRRKTMATAATQGVRRFVARRGGGGGCGGARKRVGEAMGGRWRWLW